MLAGQSPEWDWIPTRAQRADMEEVWVECFRCGTKMPLRTPIGADWTCDGCGGVIMCPGDTPHRCFRTPPSSWPRRVMFCGVCGHDFVSLHHPMGGWLLHCPDCLTEGVVKG